jgi:DnaJ-class molecular chaperone
MDGRTEENPLKFSAQKCPVCNGFGTLKYGAKICQACKGRGYVVINNETGLPVEEGGMDGRMDQASPQTTR